MNKNEVREMRCRMETVGKWLNELKPLGVKLNVSLGFDGGEAIEMIINLPSYEERAYNEFCKAIICDFCEEKKYSYKFDAMINGSIKISLVST